ncbi:hypothetical protein A9Q99_20255 [Gammaproteobacteria bacterium 45_16_T64]|nr:hypothetical protein A9Q99_20255 [Gammaproteobacteria bacterium 45_16_T64]
MVSIGIPIQRGAIHHTDHLALLDSQKNRVRCDTQVNASWPDGSVKWVLISFCTPLSANVTTQYSLEKQETSTEQSHPTEAISIDDSGTSFTINTGRLEALLDKENLHLTTENSVAKCFLYTSDGAVCSTRIHSTEFSPKPYNTACEVVQLGTFSLGNHEILSFRSSQTFQANSSKVNWSFSLHNPSAALHHGGLWDLGDEGSAYFRKLDISIAAPKMSDAQVRLSNNDQWQSCAGGLDLLQESSGGNQWNNRNHQNKEGVVPFTIKGFAGSINNNPIAGDRATPCLHTNNGPSLFLRDFWENFPKQLTHDTRTITLSLFPDTGTSHELQGGEKKTHHFTIDYGDDKLAIDHAAKPVTVTLDPKHIAATGAFIHFSAAPEGLNDIILEGIKGNHTFSKKREIIDEYGWRNYGDIYADHESLYLDDGQQYVSHYNNQYDPLYGFIRQYLYTGNIQWLRLAEPLAQHISDIDIYDTEYDREEYNGGLFWHTDHYVDAFTASHRTYSHHQVIEGDPTQGGGPGAEHCYTHGLLMHHYLTGNQQSRETVLKLTRWITFFYEGTGTITEQLLAIKQRVLPNVLTSTQDSRSFHRYPLDRGVGNYICALLDSFAITSKTQYLQQAERVIQNTVHPQDEIDHRDLGNPEETWFYTIFLQAVIRYLTVKEELSENQTPEFQYIQTTLVHYAKWMKDNETTYLSQQDKLDYPNDTWVAQEIRKAHILSYVSTICPPEERVDYETRAQFFYDYVTDHLGRSETKHFSRIQAILMQNHGPQAFCTGNKATSQEVADSHTIHSAPIGKLALILSTFRELLTALAGFSVKKELGWLRHRHSLFAKLHKFIDR